MKKRFSKLTALVLSLATALSLALPVWAVEGAATPPLISPAPAETASYLSWSDFLLQYVENHPECYEAFDADAWFLKDYSDLGTKEEFMRDCGFTDEAEFKAFMWEFYLEELYYDDSDPLYRTIDAAYAAYLTETYEASHPGELNRLKTETLLARYGYTRTLTPIEQFMKDRGLSDREKVRPILLREYTLDRLRAEDNHEKSLVYQERYPEQWANFDAGAWFAEEYAYIYDSKEEYIQYNILLSEEEFLEAMFVDYVDSESWNWGYPWNKENQPTTLLVNGEPVEAEITYSNGFAYADGALLNSILGTSLSGDRLPVRRTAETAGWDVVWNPNCNMIALYRQEDLPQGDFSRFDDLMNRLLSTAKAEKGQAYQTTETTNLKLTAFNSLDGDKTASARITTQLLQKDALYELTVTVNTADLLSLLPKQSLNILNRQAGPADLNSLLRSCKISLLLNGETGDIFLNAPILSLLDSDFTADTWFRWNAGQSLGLLADLGSLKWNTNDFLYQTLLAESASSHWGAWLPYLSYTQSQNTMGTFLGPQTFTERGGTLTWTLNTKTLQSAFPEELAEMTSMFKEYEVKLSVDRSGKMTADMAVRLDADAFAAQLLDDDYNSDFFSSALLTWAVNLLDFRMESHTSGTAERSSGNALFHWKNQFKLEMTSSSSRQKTGASPKAAPPEGAELIDFS